MAKARARVTGWVITLELDELEANALERFIGTNEWPDEPIDATENVEGKALHEIGAALRSAISGPAVG